MFAAVVRFLGTAGVLYRIKDEVLQFRAELKGGFMAAVPVGYAAWCGSRPQKQPVEMKVRYLG